MSRKKKSPLSFGEALKKKSFFIFFGTCLAVICLGILWFTGRTNTLSCQRVESSQIDCVVQTRWLGLLPLGEQAIHRVEGASVDRNCSTRIQDRQNKESCTYSVDLATAEGIVSLSPLVASGGNEEHKYDFVEQINAFVRDPQAPSLRAVETELGPQTLVLGVVSLLGLIMIGGSVGRAFQEAR